mmetsp:Transcript_11212/g.35131  ORF Transcript_11212/g.35131 Transcript_11212/m.35131 type:complete len:225 (-) Transcript_11212:71-745(-)
MVCRLQRRIAPSGSPTTTAPRGRRVAGTSGRPRLPGRGRAAPCSGAAGTARGGAWPAQRAPGRPAPTCAPPRPSGRTPPLSPAGPRAHTALAPETTMTTHQSTPRPSPTSTAGRNRGRWEPVRRSEGRPRLRGRARASGAAGSRGAGPCCTTGCPGLRCAGWRLWAPRKPRPKGHAASQSRPTIPARPARIAAAPPSGPAHPGPDPRHWACRGRTCPRAPSRSR